MACHFYPFLIVFCLHYSIHAQINTPQFRLQSQSFEFNSQHDHISIQRPSHFYLPNEVKSEGSSTQIKLKRHLQGPSDELPTSFDWRQKIRFQVVNSHGTCPNDWAYSTTAFFEALAQIQDSSLTQINFSQYYLIKCDLKSSNSCKNGSLNTPMDLVFSKGGLPQRQVTDDALLANESTNVCQDLPLYKLKQTTNARLAYFNFVNQQKIKLLLLQNPLNIKVCSKDLQNYYPTSSKEERRTLKCNPQNKVPDHSVLLIGYTETQWIIMNEWGPFWGLDGFAYISRQSDEDCCIGSEIHTVGLKSQKCPLQNCLSCINETYCTKCSPNYYLTYDFGLLTQECTKCTHLNCVSCIDYSGTCTKCLSGFSYFSDQNNCLLATISYCTLMSSGVCFECREGFILSKDYLECYQNCPLKNCKACPDSVCAQCVIGFYVADSSDGTQTCQKNPCSVPNCRLCNKNGKCIECQNYFSLNYLQRCDPQCNMDGCLICNEEQSKCQLCGVGKSFSFWTGLCQVNSFQNCFSFGYLQQLGLKCDQCKQNYAFNSNNTSCIQKCDMLNCVKCDSKDLTECEKCANGYSLKKVNGNSQCQKNPCKSSISDCLLCGLDGNCIQCSNRDFLVNVISLKCERVCNVANCEACDPERSDLCDTCKPGYLSLGDIYCYIKNDQKCVLWDQTLTNATKTCNYCETNYKAINGICEPSCKDSFCDVCEVQSLEKCAACYDGYQLIPSAEGDLCKFNVPTMLFCDLISTNQTYCFKCSKEYFFMKKDQYWGCFKVSTTTPNCFDWDSVGKCLECDNFYKLNASNFCEKTCKIPSCLACSKNGLYCDQCDEGFSMNIETKVCEAFNFSNCLNHQKRINSGNTCMQCIPGTIFNRNLTKCFQQCDNLNCAKCQKDNKAICISCEQGFYIKTVNNVTECAPYLCEVGNCSVCDDRGNCVLCLNTNFELDTVNNQCKLSCKVDSCQDCTQNLLVCLECKDQYELYNNVCYMPTPEHCAVWRLGEDSVTRIGCSRCEPKYTLFFLVKEMEPKCKMDCDDTYCEVCKSDKSTCDKCLDGFERILVDGNIYNCSKIITRIKNCKLGSSNQSHCFYCRKYYFFNSTQKQCEPYNKNCKTNCLMCSPNSFYDPRCLCSSAFIFLTDTSRCVANSLASNFCIQVQSGMNGTLCSDCVSGFKTSENRQYCEKYCDVENCETCIRNSNTECMNCMRGYYKKKWDLCKICDVENCAECNKESSCLICQDGFELVKNNTNSVVTCSKKFCPNNMIFRNQNCTCLEGTYEKDQQCYDCNMFTPNCTKCTNTTCNKCMDQFYLSQNACLPCSPRCLKCTDLLNCQQCEARYYFSPSKLRCIESALSVYAYFQNGSVIGQCPKNCVNCTNNGNCTKCEASYRVDQSSKLCVKCENDCLSCGIDTKNGNSFICISCSSDQVLTNNSCIKCTENCLLCDNLTQECAKCNEGFYLSNQNACIKCKGNCNKCTSQFDCFSCVEKFALREQQQECKECLVDSMSCNTSNLVEPILLCMEGFYLNASNCSSCSLNCLECNSSANCTRCEVGYRLTNNFCYENCNQGCFSCDPDNVAKCFTCFAGYALDSKIFTCVADLSCNANSECLNCPLSHYLKDTKCQKCKSSSTHCARCSFESPQTCLQCSSEFYLQSNISQQCQPCLNGCKYCQSQSYCQVCTQGFFLAKLSQSSQNCKQCNEGCHTCHSFTGRCLTCTRGFEYIQVKDACMNKQRVGLWIRLNLNFNDVIEKFPIVKQALLSELLENKTTSKGLFIKYIKEGSTVVDFQISTPKEQNTTQFIAFLTSKLAQLNSLGGFGIMEYSKLSSVNDKQEVPQESPAIPSESGSSSKAPLIVVSVIAGVLFVGLGVLVFILVRMRKSQTIARHSEQKVSSERSDPDRISTDQNIQRNPVINPQIASVSSGFDDNLISEKDKVSESSSKKSQPKMSPFSKNKQIIENIESAKQIQTVSDYFSEV